MMRQRLRRPLTGDNFFGLRIKAGFSRVNNSRCCVDSDFLLPFLNQVVVTPYTNFEVYTLFQ